MSLLTPDSGLLFWMIVSFGIVFVILSKYGFPVIVKAIEQRKAYIDNSLETARQANERLAHIQAEGEKMLAEAKEKQNAVLKEAFAEKERREVHPLNIPSNLVILVILANKSSGISVNEVQFEKRP